MIRVLIADDHAVVRTGLEQLLATAEDMEVVAVATGGDEAAVLARTHEPDVVLMDLSMPGVDGTEATRRILAERPETRVVALTSFSDRERILSTLDAGATGYLLKDAEPEELLEGVRSAARGEAPLNPRAAREVLAARHERQPAEGLSAREREVLDLVASGLPNQRIARELGISEKTVKAHLTRIFGLLGVTDRTQAALWARDHGLSGR
ncbi:MAG TPA: response regulator transcription factor [Solirubrobacteraceae bacterium]